LTDFDSSSPVMKNFMRMVRRVVEPDSSLLILGETGVGKERLARAIHAASPRGSGPFVPVNCAAFPETLLAGELFGYEEGAFTGASGNRRGYFEMAHGGTIFLDEIGELHQHLQVKLLRALQERRIQPLGSEQEIEIDVRIFAATNRDLEIEIAQRRFRRDLYYRLGVVTLEIPPLREHPEDVCGLILRYLGELNARMNRSVASVSPTAMQALTDYRWPGNIRELINVVERAVILCEGTELTVEMLPRGFEAPSKSNGSDSMVEQIMPFAPDWKSRPWDSVRDEIMESIERRYLHEHLHASSGRLSEVSRRTGIKSRTLFEMLKRLNIDKLDFRVNRRE
jgi:two-component system, NtrC family, response regulator AtoC